MRTPVVGRTFTVTEMTVKIVNPEKEAFRDENVRLYRYYDDVKAATKAVEKTLNLADGEMILRGVINGHTEEKREMAEETFVANSLVVSAKPLTSDD